jgi:hypothetical protein
LLRLKHGEQIGSTLAVLKLRYLEGFSGSFYLPPEMNLGLAIQDEGRWCLTRPMLL